MNSNAFLAIDIGGTKLAAGIWLPQAETIVWQRERPTLAQEGAAAILARVVALAQETLADYGERVTAVGVASAGQIDTQTGRVVFATDNLPGWTGLPLSGRLQDALNLPVVVDNDVNCFALAEATVGAGRGYRHQFLVAVGTGIGGGIVIDGQVYNGRFGGAGELGHLKLVAEGGRLCTCGLTGCLESYASSRIITARSGYENIQAVAAAYAHDPQLPAVTEAACWLGRGLGIITAVLAPEIILIGGSGTLLGPPYLAQVEASLRANSMPSHQDIPLAFTQFGEGSGLVGAGILAQKAILPKITMF